MMHERVSERESEHVPTHKNNIDTPELCLHLDHEAKELGHGIDCTKSARASS